MMILFWRIRYLDTTDGEFKDRDLWLDTAELDPVTRAGVEASNEVNRFGAGREMLKYRHLFKQVESPAEMEARVQRSGNMGSVFVRDYHEDEHGNALTGKQLAVALTGSPTAVLVPAGAKQHDIDYMFGERKLIDIGKILLSTAELKVLGYFARDLKEMESDAFFKEGPGTLSWTSHPPGLPKTLQTAVSDEEIRSFVTIFRRLYMEKEPANFQKAVAVFTGALTGTPVATWIAAGAAEIAHALGRPPDFAPYAGVKPTFSLKRLIDVFLYTQYAHQPSEERSRQFQDCLRELGNDRAVLTYAFLSELWHLAIEMWNVGRHVADFFERYCAQHKVDSGLITSTGDAHPGIGSLEKVHEREERIIREKAEQLALALWREASEPHGGPNQFFDQALKRLRDEMKGR